MIATPRTPGFTVKGWHVLVGFLVFFGVDIGVNTYFMLAAYRTFPGETSLTPYEDGVAFNAALREKRAQAALGWSVAANGEPGGKVRVEVRDRAGAPVSGLKVSAHLERPATQAGQRDLNLSAIAEGVYQATTAPLSGAWDLEVTGRDGLGRVVHADRRISTP